MATVTADALARSRRRTVAIAPALAVAAFASIGAGAIHTAAIAHHSGHRQAVIAFTIVATVQLTWGVLALLSSNRWLTLTGAALNTAAVVGWVMSRTSGISFVDGLEASEKAQFADATAAALAAVSVVAALVAVFAGRRPTSLATPVLVIGAVVTAALAVPAMISAAGGLSNNPAAAGHHGGAAAAAPAASGGAGGASSGGGGAGAGGGAGHHATGTAKPYDPNKPIDLGGVAGVTPEQQARAENLIAITLLRLPKDADYRVAEANGFRSIGDAVTGDEHFINVSYFDDGRTLDPDYPESLVYQPDGNGGRKLVAAMFMLAPDKTLDDVPDIGGKLTQWHIHGNLCFAPTGQVAGLTNPDGTCRAGLNKGNEAPMIHVWIQPHPCGPFAALEGVGAGQIKEGETRLCDAAHGAS